MIVEVEIVLGEFCGYLNHCGLRAARPLLGVEGLGQQREGQAQEGGGAGC